MRTKFLCSLLLLLGLLIAVNAGAQTCTGSLGAPVVNEDFGKGATELGQPLAPGVTTLKYFNEPCGAEDGQYAIASSMRSTSCKGGTWQSIQYDHSYYTTGDPTGYMMVINATLEPSVFFTERVSGSKFCPNTTYQFQAYIMNILRDIPTTLGFTKPNITFSIEKPDGTVLQSYNTKDIEPTTSPVWNPYSTFFISPSDGSDIIIKMTNSGKGGDGNDLALDDITFSPCGPVVQSGFGTYDNTTPSVTSCVNNSLSYSLVGRQTGYTNPSYQWQQNINNSGWVNIAGQTGISYQVNVPNAAAGRYQYRVGVLSDAQSGSENCRIYSNPLSVFVYDYPVPVLAASTSSCVGFPLQLSSTGGGNGSYYWTGPNGYTSTESSPLLTDNATTSYNGVYTVRVTTNGCPSFASTTVTVYNKSTVSPLADIGICAGSSTQLNAVTTNVTHYKWSPAAGLDRDDIANPVASPTQTTTYTVEVYNDGCPDIRPSAATKVTVYSNPVANAGTEIKIHEGDTARLHGSYTGDNIKSFIWTPSDFLDNAGSLTPLTSATGDITYTLHVLSNTCGESTSTIFVRVYKKLLVNNTFTPNGDGINDYWAINNLTTYPYAYITVFDRQGQKVYESKGYAQPWDGMRSGSQLPTGTYYYIIDPKEDNLPKTSGWVFIVR